MAGGAPGGTMTCPTSGKDRSGHRSLTSGMWAGSVAGSHSEFDMRIPALLFSSELFSQKEENQHHTLLCPGFNNRQVKRRDEEN